MISDLLKDSILRLVKEALEEDIGRGDLTTIACIEPGPAKARLIAKSSGVLSGLMPALTVFHIVDSANRVKVLKKDGDSFSAGDVILEVEGFNQTILSSERVAINFIAHLSGIASFTRAFVDKVAGTNCKILDTRKTTPGWRHVEKLAVTHGGGTNHRIGLYDMVLIKDNHIAATGSIIEAVRRTRDFLSSREYRVQFRQEAGSVKIEVEVTNEQQVTDAIECRVDRLLLDNQSITSLTHLVQLARKLDPKMELEASGNVSLNTVAAIAATGVDYISIGAITHSAPVADFSMQISG
jgi:nicotinate-nucleotide pyrophosphorylase (carboxylating)